MKKDVSKWVYFAIIVKNKNLIIIYDINYSILLLTPKYIAKGAYIKYEGGGWGGESFTNFSKKNS